MLSNSDANKLDASSEPSSKGASGSSGWRRYRRRPLAVGWVGVLLVLLGCLSLAGAPFILILEQISVGPNADGAPFPWIMLASQISVSSVFVFLGSQILKGNAWARIAFVVFGVLVLLLAFALFAPLYVAPGVLLYGFFTTLLFQSKANRYF